MISIYNDNQIFLRTLLRSLICCHDFKTYTIHYINFIISTSITPQKLLKYCVFLIMNAHVIAVKFLFLGGKKKLI